MVASKENGPFTHGSGLADYATKQLGLKRARFKIFIGNQFKKSKSLC